MKKTRIFLTSNDTLNFINIPLKPDIHNSCSSHFVKPLSKAATSVLKLMYEQIETYNFKLRYFSEVKSLQPVQNNQPGIYTMKKINSRNKAFSVASFSFSTLHTNIPHNKLKKWDEEADQFLFLRLEKTVY